MNLHVTVVQDLLGNLFYHEKRYFNLDMRHNYDKRDVPTYYPLY